VVAVSGAGAGRSATQKEGEFMQIRLVRSVSAATAGLFVSLTTAAWAQTNQPASLPAGGAVLRTETHAPILLPPKSKWLTELSLGFREGFDNKVYASGVDWKYYPSSYQGPYPGSVTAEKNRGSFFETISPRVAVDPAKLLGDDSIWKQLAFSYAPDFVFYNDAPSESYSAHRLASTIAAKCDNVSYLLDEGCTYIDGDKFGPTYPGKYYSVPGQGILRERRKQWQDRTAASLTYDQESWFLRPTFSLLDYDLKTDQLNVPAKDAGYLNYVDRYDVNGGADVGYQVMKDFAVTMGYRAGYQYQQKLPLAVDPYGQSASSDYQRLLLGIEGKPLNWLTVKFQAGPDFRDYNAAAPVRDRNPVTFYGEGSLTAKASVDDTISFNYRQWRWVSSTGCSPDNESSYDLGYKHRFADQWSGKLGVRAQSADYSCGESWTSGNHNPVAALPYYKNDWLYVFSAGVQYDVTANLSLDIAYAASLGRNAQDAADLAKMSGNQLPALKRQFDDQVVSLGAKFKF
jgi:opacity protein-like surface antigen